jgi:hypothetical protein
MLRMRIWASAAPVLIASAFAGGHIVASPRPCIPLDDVSVWLGTTPWQDQHHVSFTTDSKIATVRVQIVDSPELADFAIVDDIGMPDAASCGEGTTPRYVSVAPHVSATEPVIYLSTEPGADYRVFVQSKSATAQDAAALIVGAALAPAAPPRLAAAL